jgi:Collagen triple helix repeat (20 copies)
MHLSRPSATSIIASLALFFALGGTAIAAHHYLITSTIQIKPSVLKALRGNVGATGPAGLAGAQGPAGAVGEKGSPGNQGPQGPPSVSGASVAARIRSVAPIATTSTEETTPIFASDPLTSGTWTQHAGELNQLAGQVTITLPSEAHCGAASPFTAAIEILLDGSLVGGASAFNNEETEKTETVSIGWTKSVPAGGPFHSAWPTEDLSPWLYEPGTDTSRMLTAQVADTCVAGGHPTIKSVSVDVLGVS